MKRIAIAELESQLESIEAKVFCALQTACTNDMRDTLVSEVWDDIRAAIKACRAIVAAHNPDGFVEVPDELVTPQLHKPNKTLHTATRIASRVVAGGANDRQKTHPATTARS